MDMVDEGADIIDIGGESTRPGAIPVPAEEEMSRLLPVIDELVSCTDVPVSVDTMKASVAEACVRHGAHVINDVSGFSDPDMPSVIRDCGVPVVVMSSLGSPSIFRNDISAEESVQVTVDELQRLVDLALGTGISEDMIVTDPGVGFGTNAEQAMALIEGTSEFSLGRYPVLIGPSRKRFLSTYYPETDRDEATAQVCRIATDRGADILRIHSPGIVKRFLDQS